MLQKKTFDIIRTLVRYNACLKRKYGVDLDNVGEESAAAWEHFIAASQYGLEPEVAVGQFAKLFCLASAGSPFAKTLRCAEIYNSYRLALMKYAEENKLSFSSPGNPVQRFPGFDYYLHWGVDPIRDRDGNIIRCKFTLYDPVKWTFYEVSDINDALEKVREAVLNAENSFNQSRLSP